MGAAMRIVKLVLVFSFLFAATAQAADLKPDEIARLDKGEVLVEARALGDDGTVAARAKVVLDFPPEQIWKHLDDCARYDQFMPRVSKSTELVRDGGKVICRIEVDMPFPLGDLWSETVAMHDQPSEHTYRRRWKMPEGKGTYRQNKGAWVVSAWQGDTKRSLVEYKIKVQPLNKVPGSILKAAQKRSLPGMMEALKKRTATAK